MVAAGIGIFMLPRFGWQAMFFAAAAPLVLLPLLLRALPESVGFLIRSGREEQARAVLTRLVPDNAPTAGKLVYQNAGSTSASGQRTVAMPNLSAVSNSSLDTGATAAGAPSTPASSAGGAASRGVGCPARGPSAGCGT